MERNIIFSVILVTDLMPGDHKLQSIDLIGERGRARNFARPACASHPRKLVDSIDPSALRASRSSPCTYLICGSWGLELCAGHVIEQMGSSTLRNPWAKLQSVRFKRKGFRAQEGRLGGWLPHTSAFLEVFQRTKAFVGGLNNELWSGRSAAEAAPSSTAGCMHPRYLTSPGQ